ncbi:hypothetical protein N780_12565 [Pontibacillus chungwhensis BH030062]|uniref:Uncharacterized protein n=1 Tax=Pontibacillus chungwhensis BH030062 TaxID=1385513 RepID=A0A0A2VI79_9BACI|nr:hypothetical protein N780_12565 [Pontibacillus chungwhensis BH030062]
MIAFSKKLSYPAPHDVGSFEVVAGCDDLSRTSLYIKAPLLHFKSRGDPGKREAIEEASQLPAGKRVVPKPAQPLLLQRTYPD